MAGTFIISITYEIFKRWQSLAFNTASKICECSDLNFGQLTTEGVYFTKHPTELGCSGDGYAMQDTTEHYCDKEDHQIKSLRAFCTSHNGNAILDIHTHMSGQHFNNGEVYTNYKNPSGADVSVFNEACKILNPQGIASFMGVLSVDSDTGEFFIKIIAKRNDGYNFYVNAVKVHSGSNWTRYNADSSGLIALGSFR